MISTPEGWQSDTGCIYLSMGDFCMVMATLTRLCHVHVRNTDPGPAAWQPNVARYDQSPRKSSRTRLPHQTTDFDTAADFLRNVTRFVGIRFSTRRTEPNPVSVSPIIRTIFKMLFRPEAAPC